MDTELLKTCGKAAKFKEGEVICKEGEMGHSMFILLSGSVEITINSLTDHPQSLGKMPDGSFFGEMSLLENKPRSATIVACSDVLVLEVSEKDFVKLFQNESSIPYRLLLTLNNRLTSMLDRIEQSDKKYVLQYRENQIYNTIQKMDEGSFITISKKDSEYAWKLLKYLSASLEKLNREYINQVQNH